MRVLHRLCTCWRLRVVRRWWIKLGTVDGALNGLCVWYSEEETTLNFE